MSVFWKSAVLAAVLALMLGSLVFLNAGDASHGALLAIGAAPAATAELIDLVNSQYEEIKKHHEASNKNYNKIEARLTELEQISVRRLAPSGSAASLGSLVTQSAEYKKFVDEMRMQGSIRIPVQAALTTAPNSAGALVVPDRQPGVVGLPRQRLTIRSLLAPGETKSNLVQYTKQTGRTNNAASVSEGALKPESSIVFEAAQTAVRTIATWIPASRQIMDDAPALQSLVDQELRYMIGFEEEKQILYGDGAEENLEGLSAQVTAYDPNNPLFPVEALNMMDDLLLGIAQAQQSKIAATGIIVNDLDWAMMQTIKDQEGRYLGAGPFGQQPAVAWTLPVVPTAAMLQGSFMVGAFAVAAQIVDRMTTEVLISSEDRDNFVKNMLTIRAEERVALAVKIPEAIVFGEYTPAAT